MRPASNNTASSGGRSATVRLRGGLGEYQPPSLEMVGRAEVTPYGVRVDPVLDRLHAPHSRLGQRRRFAGSLAHRRIGGRIDLLTLLEKVRRLIGFAILVLLLPWILRSLIEFTTALIEKLPQMVT